MNKKWLSHIWSCVGGDLDDPKLMLKDMNDSINFSILVKEYIQPCFDGFETIYKDLLKETWKYAIDSYDEETLENEFERLIPAFSIPGSPREFYIKVWQALFPKESWKIDRKDFHDMNDSQLSLRDWIEKL